MPRTSDANASSIVLVDDLILVIFSSLCPRNLSKCGEVSKKWLELSSRDSLWRPFLQSKCYSDRMAKQLFFQEPEKRRKEYLLVDKKGIEFQIKSELMNNIGIPAQERFALSGNNLLNHLLKGRLSIKQLFNPYIGSIVIYLNDKDIHDYIENNQLSIEQLLKASNDNLILFKEKNIKAHLASGRLTPSRVLKLTLWEGYILKNANVHDHIINGRLTLKNALQLTYHQFWVLSLNDVHNFILNERSSIFSILERSLDEYQRDSIFMLVKTEGRKMDSPNFQAQITYSSDDDNSEHYEKYSAGF